MKILKILVLVIILGLVVGGGYYFLTQPQQTAPAVTTLPAGWVKFTDEAGVYTFNYPATLPTTYIKAQEWPPQVDLLEDSAIDCNPESAPTAHAGVIEAKVIKGQKYCTTAQSEGAAGSTYTDYAYLTVVNKRVVRLTFTLRQPQCDNYDEPQRGSCKAEQANFDLDALVGQIVASLHFAP